MNEVETKRFLGEIEREIIRSKDDNVSENVTKLIREAGLSLEYPWAGIDSMISCCKTREKALKQLALVSNAEGRAMDVDKILGNRKLNLQSL